MDKLEKVICKECGEKLEARFDTQDKSLIRMAFCPICKKQVEVLTKDFTQYST